MFAHILIPRPELSLLCYSIPEKMEINKGDCVEIELKNTKIWGIVANISNDPPPEMEGKPVKPVLGKIFSSPIFADKAQTSLLEWLAKYYIYPFPKIVKQIFSPLIGGDNSLNGDSEIEKHLSSLFIPSAPEAFELNDHQLRVVSSISKRWNNSDFLPTLIFGVTGSGKSEIFSELCKETIKKGKQVLYLVPEIGLTSKALTHLISRVGAPGVILHSYMSKKKRFSSIYCAMKKKAGIIVGTRSAILYPFFDIGLIIIDEEHDTSYKNLEPPYYNARDFAIMKGVQLKIPVVMGSATPSSDSWQNCLSGKYYLETITHRANNKPLPEIKMFPYIGDLYLPEEIVSKVKDSINSGDQSLFFLNRRGFATIAACSECKKIVKCPDCNTALIFHKKKNRLLCHHCNFSIHDFKCIECGHDLQFEGMGIEKLFETILEYFPGARIISFDRDNLSTLPLFDKAVDAILKNRGNIIVGTVMISKGHNFPKLKNVIIKYSDYILNFKDSRAAEKCFQLITQVAGRAGRFDTSGAVYAEAAYPDHYLWKYIKNHDYEGFITEELDWRKKLSLPPFTRMTLIRVSGKNEEKVNQAAEKIHSILKSFFNRSGRNDHILFPVTEPPLSKIRNRFKRNITLITPKNSSSYLQLSRIIEDISGFSGISVTFDVDPLNET